MPLARALLLLSLLLLAGCDLAPLPPGRAYPVLLPLDQILLVPVGTRAPDPGLLARGAALRARAAALGAL